MNRRSALALVGMSVAPLKASWGQTSKYSDLEVTDDWIRQWMHTPAAVVKDLHLGRFADPMYFLREPIGWIPNKGQEPLPTIDVPTGFVTDFASIPRFFWTALPKDGVYTYPAIIHDFLYWNQSTSRASADLIFKHAMEDFEIGVLTIQTVYQGVRLGGAKAWANNAKLKKTGERRILKTLPTDPKQTWEKFKKQSSVFL